MRHAQCRRSLLEGDLNPEAASHLEGCERCRDFARDLGQVSEFARSLDPGAPPPGLADRVVAGVRAGGGATPSGADARPAMRRPAAVGTLAVAAAMTLLVGVLAVVAEPRGDDEDAPLLTAAARTADAGTARIRVSGTAELEVRMPEGLRTFPEVEFFDEGEGVPALPPFEPPEPPPLDGVPPAFRDEVRESFDAQVEEMRRRYEEFATESRRHSERLRDDARAAFEAAELPDVLRLEVAVEGQGNVVFPDRISVDGEIRVVDADPEVPDSVSGAFGLISIGDRTFVRGPDGLWLETAGTSGPLARLVVEPDGIADVLEGAVRTSDLGGREVGGVAARRWRFEVGASVLAPPGTSAESTVEASVGAEDDLLRRLSVSSSLVHRGAHGFTATMDSTFELELFDFGARVGVEEPDVAGRATSPFGLAAVLHPFDPGFGFSVHIGFEAPAPPPLRFEPPDVPFSGGVPVPAEPLVPLTPFEPPDPPQP